MKATFFFLLLIPFFTKAQETDTNAVYDFLTQFIKSQKLCSSKNAIYITDKPDFFTIRLARFITDARYQKNDKNSPQYLLSAKDSSYVVNKIENGSNTTFQQEKLGNVIIISGDSVYEIFGRCGPAGWKIVRKQTGIQRGFFTFSLPIIFDNGHQAIFSYDYHYGRTGRKSDLSIYENIRGRWKKMTVLLKLSRR